MYKRQVWGEKVDAAELERTAWPRAAAVAERAWSPRAARYSARTEARLLEFRCVLLGRGVGAGRVRAAKARDDRARFRCAECGAAARGMRRAVCEI